MKRIIVLGQVVLIAGLMGGCVVYSYDSLEYVASGNLTRYHEYTWFYDVYQWVNTNTPPSARCLVIVRSGQSYYLDRPYRRADPWLSGVVDWSAVGSGQDLVNLLRAGGFRYIIYQKAGWSWSRGGKKMNAAIRDAIDRGLLRQLVSFDVRLGTLRMLRRSERSTVLVLETSGETVKPLRMEGQGHPINGL